MDNIRPYPWQAEGTALGIGWHYDSLAICTTSRENLGGYQHPKELVHLLIDSCQQERDDGSLLNVPGRPDGTIDSKEISAVLDAFTAWMAGMRMVSGDL